MYYDISGMTFSGHPFTTYFNTSSSLAYGEYYLYCQGQRVSGQYFIWAAGDDMVVWHLLDIS